MGVSYLASSLSYKTSSVPDGEILDDIAPSLSLLQSYFPETNMLWESGALGFGLIYQTSSSPTPDIDHG